MELDFWFSILKVNSKILVTFRKKILEWLLDFVVWFRDSRVGIPEPEHFLEKFFVESLWQSNLELTLFLASGFMFRQLFPEVLSTAGQTA